MKRLLIVCIALFLLLSMAVPAFAAESKAWVYDDASLLSAQDWLSVNDAAEQAKARAGCDFYVATYRVPLGYSSYQYRYTGDMFLDDHGLDSNTDLVLLVITLDVGQYYYNIYTYGEAMDRISTKEVDYILDDDDVFNNIKQGNLAPGCSAFLSLAAIGYAGRLGASYVSIAIVSAIIALAIGIGSCVAVYMAYKKKNASVDYPLDRYARLNLIEDRDEFAGTFVTKRVIQSNSGGGYGGGSAHGGGGGHRGGR